MALSEAAGGSRIRVARAGELSADTGQTPGMLRQVAFDARNPDARTLSALLTTVGPGAATGPHHHGDQETVIYVVSGRARFRFGERLEELVEAEPGDFVFIPARLAHQEVNASTEEANALVVVRSGTEPEVVNLPELDHLAEAPTTAPASPA